MLQKAGSSPNLSSCVNKRRMTVLSIFSNVHCLYVFYSREVWSQKWGAGLLVFPPCGGECKFRTKCVFKKCTLLQNCSSPCVIVIFNQKLRRTKKTPTLSDAHADLGIPSHRHIPTHTFPLTHAFLHTPSHMQHTMNFQPHTQRPRPTQYRIPCRSDPSRILSTPLSGSSPTPRDRSTACWSSSAQALGYLYEIIFICLKKWYPQRKQMK